MKSAAVARLYDANYVFELKGTLAAAGQDLAGLTVSSLVLAPVAARRRCCQWWWPPGYAAS